MNKLLSWKTADAGKQPDGWQWIWTLKAESPHSTTVSLSYDWSHVKDKEVLRRISFPLVEAHQLEGSLQKLAEMVEVWWKGRITRTGSTGTGRLCFVPDWD